MEQFFALDYNGSPFQLFGPGHLTALAIVLLMNVLLIVFRRHLNEKFRVVFRWSLAAVLIVDEIIWHLWNAATGQWTLQTMLPLHLCSLLVFLSAWMLVKKDYRIYEFAYFLGIGAATQALLTPDAGAYGFPHYRAFQVMISHGSIVTSAVYMTAVEGFRPGWASLRRVLVGVNFYLVFVGLVNWMLGSNYMFIAHKPETASLMDFLGPWPWYILAIEAIAGVLFTLMCLPFALRAQKTDKGSSGDPQDNAPIVQRLSGILSTDVTTQDYNKHMEEKYGK